MTCRDRLLPEDCAIAHWCAEFGGERKPNGQWRAECPYPGCGNDRTLEWRVRGRGIQWNSFCYYDVETLRPIIAGRLKGCVPRRAKDRVPVDHDDLIELALSDLPPMTMKLRMLLLAGLRTSEALDRLGVRREHRSRVIAGKTGGASKRMRNRRS